MKIVVIGLGYVGLPLAAAFAEKYDVTGYDIDEKRINALRENIDITGEVASEKLVELKKLEFSHNIDDIKEAKYYIVTVPTPVTINNNPNLEPLISASEMIAPYLQNGAIVIYESTVFPGATEEICIPALEKISKKKYNKDFFVGYSPERINPGDKKRSVKDIIKITSGSNVETLNLVDKLYKSIITAGTYPVRSIKIAEAAKVIENTQRDINIAFMNEISKILNIAGINSKEVLDAASSKWNFLNFTPGLVGGHCIGVDPYYLTNKAEVLGYYPELLLASRRVNESMPLFVVNTFIKGYIQKAELQENKEIAIFGISFKEDCTDTRNSKVFDIIKFFKEFGFNVDVIDGLVKEYELKNQIEQTLQNPRHNKYAGVILAVPHLMYRTRESKYFRELLTPEGLFYDLKSVYRYDESDFQL